MDDREAIIAAGLTEAEADCWELAWRLAVSFQDLPVLHLNDYAEVAQAIHVIQSKLLGRPTYRRYRELARPGTQGSKPGSRPRSTDE